MNFSLVFGMATLSASLLTACGPDPAISTEAPRAVKLETAGRDAQAPTRFVATVRQEQRAELAFENGGRVLDVAVDVGDRVLQGQVLARLDPEPARLRLAQARANARAAAAQLTERQTQLRQQQAMLADGAISQATLTSAQVALELADAQLRAAQSDLALAERALRQSALRAPFAGSVVARLVQPQADAAAGQAVLQLEGRGRAQALAALPADLVRGLEPGSLVQAQRADATGALMLRLRGVSPRLDEGAGVQAIFDVLGADSSVRSGDGLLLALAGHRAAPLSLPLSALVAQRDGEHASVFVYQPTQGVVRRRALRLGAIEGDRVQVGSGVAPGEQVVVAGAAFLADGQAVRPFRAESHLVSGDAL